MKPLAFVLCVCFSVSLHAQEISPLVSFEFGSPLFFNRDAGVLNQFGSDSVGTSACYSYGIGAQVRWPRLAKSFGVASNLQFIYSTATFNFEQPRATVDGIDRKLRLELSVLESVGNFSFRAGGWVSARLGATVYEHDSSGVNITPQDATSAKVHVGPSLGADYDFGNLRASLFGNYDLTSDAGSHGVAAGISFAYNLGGSTESSQKEVRRILQEAAVRDIPAGVRFLVNDLPHGSDLQLEKVEQHIQEYAMQPDTVLFREWIEESYHLPHIRLEVSTEDTAYVTIKANGALINRKRVLRNTSLELNELSALDIHHTNVVVAQIEHASAADSLILPEASASASSAIRKPNEYRFSLIDKDSAHLAGLLARMKSLSSAASSIVVRTPHGDNWNALSEKLRATLGAKAKFKSAAYSAHEITVVMNE